MKTPGPIISPPLLILETAGIALLVLAWLSVNQYLELPGVLGSGGAALIMIFAGVGLMLPAAVALILAMSRRLAPQLMSHSESKKEKPDDTDH
ncbi:DUF1418 family protein [Shimwellia blattae]|uniref:Putative inner membrane protein n=1 Tax=Shimwellia blattae (strain ATCC 29907 / DSM 4481 / JCM 1650 / NBRC 105725 / CDC 9005-74) TaxID=630626 RepID=I2BAU2_SHIBC|nr:DUF1418 family protein [Shimwellia blattae]AFJ47646.1 putative inner membrane protein [Shimwellia blattae DSM 4481 = NBRC 105725]GAB79776.1 hypothetical protein YbjC [Shimwellia blattae DSM 4481 = NBRC 105725]VDY65147.1 Protein of uncharacterised function (DUF1418) [Shimwellia blattae]VEC23721.1 Protein of uncharacterised function (DUF1418) [Shimwellia blattae]